MIADHLLGIAMFVFVIMFIGLVLTFLEFKYGEPKRQQERSERKQKSDD
jgi:phosphotransferase system  glucose/maltose/N-acetylglucosamine-specific IIC component